MPAEQFTRYYPRGGAESQRGIEERNSPGKMTVTPMLVSSEQRAMSRRKVKNDD